MLIIINNNIVIAFVQSIHTAYKSLYEIVQPQPSFGSDPPRFHLGANHPAAPSGHLNQRGSAQQGGQYSTLSLFFITTTVPLIIYTTLRILRARFVGCNEYQKTNHHSGAANKAKLSRADTAIDKRKLARLSREERVRELIIHHGGRNVSSAVRFLASELEKNKQLLLASLTRRENITCQCSCHVDSEVAQTTSVEHTTGKDHTSKAFV